LPDIDSDKTRQGNRLFARYFASSPSQDVSVEQPCVTALTGDDILGLPEIGIEIPVNELYEDITFPEEPQSEA
jgi:hypothetical protein